MGQLPDATMRHGALDLARRPCMVPSDAPRRLCRARKAPSRRCRLRHICLARSRDGASAAHGQGSPADLRPPPGGVCGLAMALRCADAGGARSAVAFVFGVCLRKRGARTLKSGFKFLIHDASRSGVGSRFPESGSQIGPSPEKKLRISEFLSIRNGSNCRKVWQTSKNDLNLGLSLSLRNGLKPRFLRCDST